MAENEISKFSSNIDDDYIIKKSGMNNSNSLSSKLSDDNAAKPKTSFLSNLRKKFSFHKIGKSKDCKIDGNANNTTKIKRESTKLSLQNDCKSDKNSVDSCKGENKFTVMRKSFGKGKNKENSSYKSTENIESINNREPLSQNQTRLQSMHIAYSHPPRNMLLASFGWYWGPLSRSEATHRLRHQEDGSFLVRDSEGDPNKFTLSFKGAGQIFHNRILQNHNKYAFLPDEEFDSIPDLISDAMRRSTTSAYCFSRSTDVAPSNPLHNANLIDAFNVQVSATNGSGTPNPNSAHNKHEVRLLKSISRFSNSPRSLYYLSRFMIRQYCRLQDLSKLVSNQEILLYLEDSKYNI